MLGGGLQFDMQSAVAALPASGGSHQTDMFAHALSAPTQTGGRLAGRRHCGWGGQIESFNRPGPVEESLQGEIL